MSAGSRNAHFAVTTERSAHAHALPPILLGLLAPMLVFLLIDPRALADASLIAHVYMVAIFVIASIAYFISVFETPESTGLFADRASKLITVEKTGLLARSKLEIPFADVASVRMDTRYDDDGYYTSVPVLILTTRENVPLPAGTTEADIATLRAMLLPNS